MFWAVPQNNFWKTTFWPRFRAEVSRVVIRVGLGAQSIMQVVDREGAQKQGSGDAFETGNVLNNAEAEWIRSTQSKG